MDLRSPLGRVRGAGPSGTGSRVFLHQRLSAVALAALCLWLVVSVLSLSGADWGAFHAWIALPWNTALLSATLVLAFFHGQIGLQVILEDYVSGEWTRLALIVAVRIAALLLGLFSVAAVLRTAFMEG